MTPENAYQRRDEVQFVDVRELYEWDEGHIEGATHIPMGELPDRLGEVARDRDVVAVCRSGSRSDRSAAFLRERGYRAENLTGGLLDWDHAGLPLIAGDGGPGTVA